MPFGGIYRRSQLCERFQALQKRLPLLVICFVAVLALADYAHFSDATATEFTRADIRGGMIRNQILGSFNSRCCEAIRGDSLLAPNETDFGSLVTP